MKKENHADIIFIGSNIITVDDKRPIAEALAVKDGIIVAVGSQEEVLQWKGDSTEIIELGDNTLMPGLVEPHSHPVLSALFYDFIDISGFNNPNGKAVINKLREAASKAEEGEWIFGFGLDFILMRDLKSFTADFLDTISTTNPIFLMIQSMHTAFVNHKALEVVGITKETPDPGGGGYYVKDNEGNLTGMLIEQSALFPFIAAALRNSSKDNRQLINNQLMRYARAGYTTVGAAGIFPVFPNAMNLVKEIVQSDDSPIRMALMNTKAFIKKKDEIDIGTGNDKLSNISVKFWYDGSPYTGSMLLDEPYMSSELMQVGLGVQEGIRGEPVHSKEKLRKMVLRYHNAGWQVVIHGQGDRATREILDIYESILKESPREDHRHRIEHCALISEEQIERAARLGVTLSWHVNHIYYYGEALRDEIIGTKRAKHLMQIGTAQKYGHRCSLHNDSPMYPAEPLRLMRTAITRKTRNSELIAVDQAVKIEDAIKMVTINAAWQMSMEERIGSLEVGKLADLVVLSENPLNVEPERLDQIQVIRTYIGGMAIDI